MNFKNNNNNDNNNSNNNNNNNNNNVLKERPVTMNCVTVDLSTRFRPDLTVMVDWGVKNQLSIYRPDVWEKLMSLSPPLLSWGGWA